MADFNDALLRYRQGRFTGEDITRCTGVSVRAFRELIKLKALRTVPARGGRGRIRLCDQSAFKRAAVIGALNKSGLNLAVAGQIAYWCPFHTLLYAMCDPFVVLFQRSIEIDAKTGLPPRVARPTVDWFDPAKPAKAEPAIDWLIQIFDGRFIGVCYEGTKGPKTIFGDLRQDAKRVVAWLPRPRPEQLKGSAIVEMTRELLPTRFVDFVAEWEDPAKWPRELKSIGYDYDKCGIDDPLHITAQAAVQSPVIVTTINVTLALRKALRRYLGIEPADPDVDISSEGKK
jgi:hypothetical protein